MPVAVICLINKIITLKTINITLLKRASNLVLWKIYSIHFTHVPSYRDPATGCG